MSKNFDETVRLQSEKSKEWIREVRGERLQGIAEGASSAPRLASSSAASFPGRNECPGTHCSMIEQEERENSSCRRNWGKRKNGGEDRLARTGWRGQSESEIVGEKRNGKLVGAAETSKERAQWRRLQQKLLSILSLLKRKEWPQCHRERAVGKCTRAAFAKRKRAVCPEHQIVTGERVKVSESSILARERGIRARASKLKGGLHSKGRQVSSGRS